MAKHIALFSCICILISCTMRKPESDYAQLIKGDWLGEKQPEGFEHDQTEFLSFGDSTLSAGIGQGVMQYKLVNDTLYFTDEYEGSGIFTIVTLTKDSLVLLSGKRQQNTIKYSRAKTKNNITPAFIYYADPRIYKGCPITALEIDSSRNVRFFSTMAIKFGAFKGRLSEKVYQSILSKIRALPGDPSAAYYTKPHKDDNPIQVAIVHENRVTRFSACRHSRQSVELLILIDKLMQIDVEVNEQRDTSIDWTYFEGNPILNAALRNRLPPPPPLTIEMRPFTPSRLED